MGGLVLGRVTGGSRGLLVVTPPTGAFYNFIGWILAWGIGDVSLVGFDVSLFYIK